ncbi:MAG: carbon-nitrogen hydrolase [Leptospiraceae bacterium]|nr:carbon-nitrogen hydrolase [Leptospiraceae bacterium]MCB1316645.1 carbon-nitrogen hydrolase [Leptospiraceae bacterium]
MHKPQIIMALPIVLLICGYQLWAAIGRAEFSNTQSLSQEADADIPEVESAVSYGFPQQNINLLGIQPDMRAGDYRNAQSLYNKLNGYLLQARQRDWIGERTIVIFPEYIGTWLVAANEKESVYSAPTMSAAMQALVSSNVFQFVWYFLDTSAEDRASSALFAMKGAQMARQYAAVFSSLAREYAVTIVAGSIVLPEPRVIDGRIITQSSGPLYNASFVFQPDGTPAPTVIRKVYPIEDELPFLQAADVDTLPAVDTAAGKLGILICADAWYPDVYARLASENVRLAVVPAYLAAGDDAWNRPWRGYNGAPPPADVNPLDATRLTEGEAWNRYALPGRAPRYGMYTGMTVFLRGTLWNLQSDGHTLVLRQGQTIEAPKTDGAALVNLWL